MKKQKPEVILTRAGLDAAVTAHVQSRLAYTALLVKMEEEKTAVDKSYASDLTRLNTALELSFAAVSNYCALHRGELLPDEKRRKSFETINAILGYADNPPTLGKTTNETFEQIAQRLAGLVFKEGMATLDCAGFVREKLELNKETIKDAITADLLQPRHLKVMGLKLTQEERFFIEPKSNLLDVEAGVV